MSQQALLSNQIMVPAPTIDILKVKGLTSMGQGPDGHENGRKEKVVKKFKLVPLSAFKIMLNNSERLGNFIGRGLLLLLSQ